MTDEKYKDIIDMPHRVSPFHRQMPIYERAAQFAPFAALTGYGDAIDETARVTDKRAELSDDEKEIIDSALRHAAEDGNVTVQITFFLPDEKKSGGAYKTVTGKIKKVDEIEKTVIMQSGEKIPVKNIFEVYEAS